MPGNRPNRKPLWCYAVAVALLTALVVYAVPKLSANVMFYVVALCVIDGLADFISGKNTPKHHWRRIVSKIVQIPLCLLLLAGVIDEFLKVATA